MHRRGVLAGLLGVPFAACASEPEVWAGSPPGVGMGGYRTFAWGSVTPPPGTQSVVFEHVRRTVDAALRSKGYVSARPADLDVVLSVSAKERYDVHTWGHTWGGYGDVSWYDPRIEVFRYTEGKLAVDVFDAESRLALWHGEANEIIDPVRPDFARLEAAATLVMTRFPPTGGSR